MMSKSNIDSSVSKIAFWAVVVFIVGGITSLFFPLIPEGEGVENQAAWVVNNSAGFISGWLIQIVLVFAFSLIVGGVSWQFSKASPVRAVVSWSLILLSMIAFLIPKFIAVWAIPMMAVALNSNMPSAELAAQLLALLDMSSAFSLFTSFDYLGFSLYAALSLMIAGPLFRTSLSGKIAAVCFMIYGAAFFLALIGTILGSVGQADMALITENLNNILFIAIISLAFYYRKSEAPASQPA